MQGKSGINQTSLRDANLKLIIRALHAQQNCTRVSLARDTGLTQATITNLVNWLIETGLVVESFSLESEKGRRPIALNLNGEKYLTLTGRVNRDYVSVGLYDIAGKLYFYEEEKVRPVLGAEDAFNRLKSLMHSAIRSSSATILGIGMAVTGPFDYRQGRIALMSSFPGWEQIDLKPELEKEFHLPVCLEQDANCGALAELWYGAHKHSQNMLYILSDRGVGAGLILNGQIYRGRAGFAGEFGHMSINCFGPLCECGNRGCVELYGSTLALEAEYQRSLFEIWQQGGGRMCNAQVTATDICRMVREDDPLARRAYEKAVGYLAFGAAGAINLLNPDVVIFADKITEGGDYFLEIVKSTFSRYLMHDVFEELIVDVSTLQGSPEVRDPILLGAGVLVLEHLLESPTHMLVNA